MHTYSYIHKLVIHISMYASIYLYIYTSNVYSCSWLVETNVYDRYLI